ncbi:TPA: hypothetical protein NDY72_000318 [Enterobacter cloacae]|uniref:hypothetical protein n=1 Tax=Enterobacter cloacae TaxID=550 RepID=UPI00211B8126|nr:hypothetical protein [Enterobacter cloacae]MCQ9484387.1 hypothetical protein [Enterobacter cloacae]MCQ9527445.1 hypothetical protein [Enterobacter cloacae]MCQ9570080.1 hypothetical protein [Enterobacter cloacae]HCD7173185.1 hypothetical protein [Enterobacter cloacae]HDC4657851.1 hypothetical protein [Enterobacter cloacae]
MMSKVNRSKFNINRGLAPYDDTAVQEPAITLVKVTHLDMDSAIVGCEAETYFLKPTAQGFIYLSDLKEVAKAYDEGELYHAEGNW